MFCPKCGSQNADETKFCRGCGAKLSDVLASLEDVWPESGGKNPRSRTKPPLTREERAIALNSRGIRGTIGGAGFLFISMVVYSRPPQDGILWLWPLAFAIIFLSTGFSRLIQARGLRALTRKEQAEKLLPEARTEFVQPPRSLYETDDLQPMSVTERTTNLLKMDEDEDW